MLTEGRTEAPQRLGAEVPAGSESGACAQGVPRKLGRDCRLCRVIGLQGESEPEITESARGVGGTERKKNSANGSRSRRGQTEVSAEGRQLSERLIVPMKPGNSSREDPVKGSGRRL
jgi:hypothetical protein